MSDTENDKPKLGMRQPLGLKRTVETGKVKQSFSHGRSNTVVVEVKRRRVLGPQGQQDSAPETVVEAAPPPPPPHPAPQPSCLPPNGTCTTPLPPTPPPVARPPRRP
ncbi:translation initiation factor IF-2 associated domain-containing protein, partial [Sphingomonas koreensis]|uniref:translation initiation factor IF-2 associated domain-containing protein n=1 Tax=Sphingomonas koreensis TaxID=93064 RepID=UPI001F49D8AB